MKKMIKVLLSSIICLSTLVGCSSSPYAKAEEQTLTIQGVPVYVEPDEETTQEDIDRHLKEIRTQPEFLMKNCTGIHLQGKSNYTERMQQNYGGNYGNTAGCAEGKEIYLNTKIKSSTGERTSSSIRETVSHELWHVFDYVNGTDEHYLSELDFNILPELFMKR